MNVNLINSVKNISQQLCAISYATGSYFCKKNNSGYLRKNRYCLMLEKGCICYDQNLSYLS
jgi:hypothetical protein